MNPLKLNHINISTNSMISETIKYFHPILSETKKKNLDNISRTKAYLDFYQKYPEIPWSFLASMVSRNGGWNMCDLQGKWFPKIIPQKVRSLLFMTYERANWLIFQDAFPQMLLYHYSTKIGRPMFHLLPFFHVSSFMVEEWNLFWNKRNEKRLMTALIINEQNVIQKPVIEHPVYKDKVFRSIFFIFQDWFHFSSVLFPTCDGELFGASVNGFRKVDNRIDLGKRLADILFAPRLFPYFLEFALCTEHTGSRYDYEQYFFEKKQRDTPFLRVTFPVISHHIHEFQDWSIQNKVKKKWFAAPRSGQEIFLSNWYNRKQRQLHELITITEMLKTNLKID